MVTLNLHTDAQLIAVTRGVGKYANVYVEFGITVAPAQ